MAELNALWQEIAAYGRNLQNVPLSEIQGRLDAFKQQIMEVIGATPAPRRAVPPARPPHDGQPLAGSQPDGDPRRHGRCTAARHGGALWYRPGCHCARAAAHGSCRHGHCTGSGHAVAGTHGHGPAGAVGRGARAGDAPAQLLGAGPRVRATEPRDPVSAGRCAGGNWAGASHRRRAGDPLRTVNPQPAAGISIHPRGWRRQPPWPIAPCSATCPPGWIQAASRVVRTARQRPC